MKEKILKTFMQSNNSSKINSSKFYWYFRLSAFIVLLLYFFIATFPNFFNIIKTGLDPSWVIAINYAFNKGLVFGKDIVFTYGPLGFLLTPLNYGSNIIYGAIFQIFVHILWIIFFIYIAFYYNLGFKVFAFVFLVTGAIFLVPSIETQLLFLIPFGLIMSINNKHWVLIGIPITILAAFGLLIKFSLGPPLFLSIIVYALLWIVQSKKNWKIAVITILIYIISVITFWLIVYGNLHAFFPFLYYSWEITSGFSTAMGGLSIKDVINLPVLIRIWDLPLALICISIFLVMVFITKTGTLRNALLILAFPVFVSFKHGFVREDFAHIPLFFSFFLMIAALSIFYISTKEEKKIANILIIIAVFSTGVAGGQLFDKKAIYVPLKMFYEGSSAIGSLFHWSKTLHEVDRLGNINLEKDKLPSNIQQQIKQNSVDVIPWEIGYIQANHLNWAPSPIFQAYSAYTSKLDNLNAQHISGMHFPEYIIYQFESIDNRHPFFDEPETLLEIYKWYNANKIGNLILFSRRAKPRYDRVTFLGSEKAGFNKPIVLPDVNTPLVMKVHVRIGIFWKLVNLVYRLPTFTLMVHFNNGESGVWRLVPGTMEDGIIINVLPTSLNETYLLFGENKYVSKVKDIEFFISNHNIITPPLTIGWLTIPIKIFSTFLIFAEGNSPLTIDWLTIPIKIEKQNK